MQHGGNSLGLLDPACGRFELAGSRGRELLAGGLSAGGLACGLLGARHLGLVMSAWLHGPPRRRPLSACIALFYINVACIALFYANAASLWRL